MAKTQVLSVDLLRIDAGTQSRISIDEDVVEDYAELIESNGEWPLGPLDVFHDGNDHLVADGFHRTLAAVKARRNSVPCRVHKGTAKDARIFGMTANDRHGLRMSRADKRACVEWLLDQPGKSTQTEVAELAGVSRRTVAQAVADRKPQNVQTSHPYGGGATNQHPQVADVSAGGEGGSSAPAGAGTSGENSSTESPEEEFPEDETLEEMCERETSEIESWARQIAKLMKEAQNALADVPTLDELNARTGWERKLNEAIATLRGTKPVQCPLCDGDNKKCACKGHGRVTKQQYKQMA